MDFVLLVLLVTDGRTDNQTDMKTLMGIDLLGYGAVWFCRLFPTFQRNITPLYSGLRGCRCFQHNFESHLK